MEALVTGSLMTAGIYFYSLNMKTPKYFLDYSMFIHSIYINMDSVIQKWGNSLGIRIPKNLAVQLNLNAGSHVEIRLEDDKITIIPQKKISLEEKLAGITPENIHHESWNDESVGKESW